MTVQNFAEFRLDDPQVCEFLTTQSRRLEYKPAIAENLLQDGYEMKLPEYVSISDTEEDISLCYYKKTTWQAFEKVGNRPRGKFESFQTFSAECTFRVILQMYIAPGVDDATTSLIANIFYNLDMNRLANEGMAYVNELVQDAEAQGAGVDTYHLILSFQLARKTEKDTEVSDSLVGLKAEMSNDYDLRFIEDEFQCGLPDLGFDGSEIEVDDLQDTVKIEKLIEQEIEKEAAKFDCGNLDYRKHRVGTLFQYPEFKTVWRKKRIKIGRCTFATIYYPQFFTRTRKNVLYASTAIPKSVIAAMEKGAVECLIASASSTALLAIISGGVALPVAAKVFVAAFTNCIKIKFGNIVRCVVPKLSVVVEKTSWGAI